MAYEGLPLDRDKAQASTSHASPSSDSLPQSLGRGLQNNGDPMELVYRAYDAIEQGVLVVSKEGIITHYNAAYAQIRNIAQDTLVGQHLKQLDRRHSIQGFLQTGKLPPVKAVEREQRRNQESVIPIRVDGRLLGSLVLVNGSVATGYAMSPEARRRTIDPKTPWTAQYSAADIVGASPALEYARDVAMRAARFDSTVLLIGESGTGKELFAHAIHTASQRQAAPFVPVDCASISRELLEAELFGYAPGAFTGATKGLDHGIGHFTHSPPQQSASDRRITYLKSMP
jgi:transcriptional regulator with PAS, ATPase and Fis domain